MADIYTRTCFAFRCCAQEWSLLQEAFLLAMDLSLEVDPADPSAEFMTLFPAVDGNRWVSFLALFDDPRFPDFGADLAGGVKEDSAWEAIISAETSLDAMAVARLIQRCCRETLATTPIGFEWAVTCSRQRIGEFGGGWCAIFADRIEIETTMQLLSMALAEQCD